ncbi:hypothetical protein OC861_005556 [Tilletia horrida]|nr:hypothetical protein OC861_005556 [Tilletia horrida]
MGRCTTGNDCLSRSCVSGTCAFSKYNGTCEINQDCAEGLCRSGKCVKSVVGDACYYDKECSGSQVCGPNSTCYVPGYRTLYPQDTCSYNYQCKNNRCVAGLKGSDQDDNQYEYGSYGAYELDRKRCDYNSLGEKGCRDYRDCTVGICRSNKCQLGFSGLDLCMKNQHCAGLCTSEGVCRDLPVNGTVADRQACTTSAQCNPATGDDCEIGWIGRPFPADRSQIHYVYDTICQYPGTDIE